MTLTPQANLTPLHTFALPATAEYLITCESLDDLQRLSCDEYFAERPFLIMGGGSNLLFTQDYAGIIVRYTGSKRTLLCEEEHHLTYRVEAGHHWDSLVRWAATQGYWGSENLALIPGDTGAAAVQNIGAYGVEICDIITAVHTIDLRSGEQRSFSTAACDYGYRHSYFKSPEAASLLVYAVDLRWSKEPQPRLSYAGLQELAERPALTPMQVVDHVVAIRESKLPDPAVLPSAGSFFMNPVIPAHHFATLQAQYPALPHYVVGNGDYKVPAAWLIEQCGFKGKRYGAVGCYERQPLVIVNYGGASPADVVAHAQRIIDAVRERFAITLTPEVRYV